MKRMMSFLLAGALALTGFAGVSATAQEGKLTVYASFYPMYDFATKVGGDRVTVVNMVPAGMEPHDWEPEAKDVIGLENADVFVYNGAGMEHWVDKVLATLSNQDLVVVDTSQGQTLLEGHSHDDDAQVADAAHEEDEAYDPHLWLGPLNAKAQMASIKQALVAADLENAAYYEANYAAQAAAFDALDADFRAALGALPNKTIVVSHQSFGYLCAAYGLVQESIEGLTPDSEPDPARMAEVIDFVKARGITTIFFEELVNPKIAETIAGATGAQTAVLSPLEGLTDVQAAAGGDYISVMRENLAALVKALQ